MILNFKDYKDKVYACWIGKNIGGTMGGPYECTREMLDISGYSTEPGVVLPNDDLDLQLVWLFAMEQNGPSAINATLLGEYWLSLITPCCNEYGIGKENMKRHIAPPISGDFENYWQNSNGAWIRTEIWATLAPGMPHIAAKYAMEDAMVDHGAGEGTFAAAFVAALQSAAFVIKDLRKCIEIGLAAIPENSRMAKSVAFVIKCYDEGMSWKDARCAVQQLNADIGDGWFEAPSNVAYAVIGMLWGEGDFKKTMITAINCGDDTDCTAATVGATMGILYGTAGIPEDWSSYIGDSIVTISIGQGGNGRWHTPKTCTELTERVVKMAPTVLYLNSKKLSNYPKTGVNFELPCELGEVDDIPEDIFEKMKITVRGKAGKVAEALKPNTLVFENTILKAHIYLSHDPVIEPNGEIGIRVEFEATCSLDIECRNLRLRWLLPDGFTASGVKNMMLPNFDSHRCGCNGTDFVIKAGDVIDAENRLVLEVVPVGRVTPMYCPVVLLG